MTLNVVLVNPQIPQNTGNIGRLCAATRSVLHLIKPMAFEITDAKVKRAGLDYWPEIDLRQYQNWEEFLRVNQVNSSQLWLLTKKGSQSFYSANFKDGDYLVFGAETTGIPEELHRLYPSQRMRIPMDNPNVRSLNLANSVSIVLYEARRQLGLVF